MKLLADMHISPVTVERLRRLGHDVVRVDSLLPPNASDDAVVEKALETERVILSQDLDFTALIALRRKDAPSLISLRLSSSRIEHVGGVLERILPTLEDEVARGAIVTVEDRRLRIRKLPVE